MNTITPTTTQRATLYFREGTSDKIYQVVLEPSGERFVVNFAYGRRGSTLSTGTKTSVPVDLEHARTIFEKLVREKTAKGYTPGETGTPYQHTEHAGRSTGLVPMLLNPVDADEVEPLLTSEDWCMQEKFDGRRVLIQKAGNTITGVNRRGLVIDLPERLVTEVATLPDDILLDGECVGDRFHAFDLLELRGQDYRIKPLIERVSTLVDLLGPLRAPSIQPVNTAYGEEYKRQLLNEFWAAGREGVVFKRLDAPYTPGRPNSGGTALKYKFTATLSAMVTRLNPRRSVALQLHGKQSWQPCGNVTIPPNESLPRPGDVVEVRYLYAFPESGVLFQPVYLGKRTDLLTVDCGTGQLKFKPSDTDEDA